MEANYRSVRLAFFGLVASLLAGCGSSGMSGSDLTAEQVRHATLTRVQSATAVLASDQHVFRYDGRSSRTFTACDGTVCGVSPTSGGLEAALARAASDARFDFGSSHFAARLEDSLELKPQTRAVNGVTLVEGYGLRSGGRRRPAGSVGAVAPRNAAQVDGVEQERPDVDILAAGIGGDLPGDHRFCSAGRSPYQGRLAGLDQKCEGGGEFAGAQRVVGGDGVRGRSSACSGMAGRRRGHPPGARPSTRRQPGLPLRPACRPASGAAGDAGCVAPRDVCRAAPSHRPADARSRERKMDQWDRELAKAGIQMAGAAAKGMGNVMVAVIDGLIEKGVFSIEEIRDMLDRLEARRAEGKIEGDLAQEAEVAATMAIVDHLRDILISEGRPG